MNFSKYRTGNQIKVKSILENISPEPYTGPISGYRNTQPRCAIKLETNPANIAPFQPPALLPNTPTAQPSKNIMIGLGKTMIGEFTTIRIVITTNAATTDDKKPIIAPMG